MTKSAFAPRPVFTAEKRTHPVQGERSLFCTPSPTLEALPPNKERGNPCLPHTRGGRSGRPYARAGRTFGNRSIQGRRPGAARSLGPLPRLLLGDADRVVLRIPVAPLVGRLRVVRAVPVPAVHVRAHTLWAQVDLRPVRERVGCGLAGEA